MRVGAFVRGSSTRSAAGSAKRAVCCLALLSLAAGTLSLTQVSSDASQRPANVYVFPIPGSRFATPQTQISFRGLPIRSLGRITVTGSHSGPHPGALLSDSDHAGGSFVPSRPFTPGEEVTVQTRLNVIGGQGGLFRFWIVDPAPADPASPFGFVHGVPSGALHFHSRPDLVPAAVTVLRRSRRAAAGDLFLAPHEGPVQNGVMILDSRGRLVWFKPLPDHHFAANFGVQRYRGQPVLTWWQGTIHLGTGEGEDVIEDSSYHQIAAIHAANGLSSDFHEFQLTPRGTALITAYDPVYVDARAVGGSAHQDTLDGVVQEIDIPTGLVLFQWDSLDHVPLVGSHGPMKSPYNYFHLNSIDEDADGNLVISGRNTWSAYKVNHQTAQTMWVVGGSHSTFKMASGAQFAWQHDVRVRGSGDRTVTLFDDGGAPYVHDSRALTLRLNPGRALASVLRQDHHVPPLRAKYEGNVQLLRNGDDFVGWGQAPYFSEYDSAGGVVFDARFVDHDVSYRAFRFQWNGRPTTAPSLAALGSGGRMTVWASWNGATGVASWRVLGGSTPQTLRPIGSGARQGFETALSVSRAGYVKVEALDTAGHVLRTSRTLRVR